MSKINADHFELMFCCVGKDDYRKKLTNPERTIDIGFRRNRQPLVWVWSTNKIDRFSLHGVSKY